MSEAVNSGTDRRLLWLLSSSAVSNLGDGIGKVAFPLLAATLTRDPVLIAGLSATQFLPWLLFALVAGALVDRIDRRKAMIYANLARALIVGAMAVLVSTGGVTIAVVYVAALLIGTAETLADSAANVLIPAVVDHDRLESANSKLQACEIVGQTFLGGPIGSATFALFAVFPFLLNSAGFALAAGLLIALAGSYRGKTNAEPTRLRADLAEGIGWLVRHRLMLRLVVIAGLVSLTSELAQAQLVLYALEDAKLSEATFGFFALIGGVGGLAGAAVAPKLIKRTSRGSVLSSGIVCCGLGIGGMGLITQPVVSATLFGLFAAAIVAVNVVLGTVRHSVVPSEFLGRVLGVWRTVVWGAVPVGALLGGLLTRALGTSSATFLVSGVLLIGIGGFSATALRTFSLDVRPVTACAQP
ncbi:Predicted arabinose efflux permease, MFS family [Amycolatopsis xylanica]|uniref:Predicted arabinose efflux permease, MFS family n=1 Tax=Amycolatopsis xylanica TaxID=589385 RepID=A0A1H3STL6_9PSEU|nr:MFS transporter [Amycolatopsis xylanica]SDZ41312.1 Predicted arabinose efflux permease, MFS family [Amycolatopsis xylanica]